MKNKLILLLLMVAPLAALSAPKYYGSFYGDGRSVTNILGSYCVPQQFGAVGDGSTDDTAALQAWLRYAGQNDLIARLPPATGSYYKITDTLWATNSVIIEGTGGQRHNGSGSGFPLTKSQIRQFGVGKSGIIFTNYGSSFAELDDNFEVRDLAVTCEAAAYTYNNQFGIGFHGDSSDSDHCRLQNVIVDGFGKGVSLVGVAASQLDNCDLVNNGDCLYSGGYGANSSPILNCIGVYGGAIAHGYTNNVLLTNVHQITFVSVDFVTSGSRSPSIINSTNSNMFVFNCDFENGTTNKPAISMNGGKMVIEGGIIQLFGTASDRSYAIAATNATIWIGKTFGSSQFATDGFSYVGSNPGGDGQLFFGPGATKFLQFVGGSTRWTNYVSTMSVNASFPSLMGTTIPSEPHQWQITDRVGGQANSTLYFTARFFTLLGNANVVGVDLLNYFKQQYSTITGTSIQATNYFLLNNQATKPALTLITSQVALWNSNQVLYGISGSKTNLITDLRP